jgi:hypothetical protein
MPPCLATAVILTPLNRPGNRLPPGRAGWPRWRPAPRRKSRWRPSVSWNGPVFPNETIRVYVQYEYQTKDGRWVWYPKEPKKGQSRRFGPGKKGRVGENDVPIHCRRYRLWAESVDGNTVWNQPTDKDYQACPDQGYLARDRPVFTHRLFK